MIKITDISPEAPRGQGDPAPDGRVDPMGLGFFRRQIESMQWRMDAFRTGPDSDSTEVFQALEATMEELRVAVEELCRTDQALQESRAQVEAEHRRYRDLFDLAPDAYLVTDLQGIIREANHAATIQLNIDTRFLVGKPLVVFLPEEARPAFRGEITRIRDVTGTVEYDLRFVPRKLEPIDASVRVGVVRDAWGQPSALRWTIRDISPRKRAEGKIRALNEQLEREVAERSHQLESELQINERWLIKAHAAAGDDGDDEAPGGQFFREIVEEVDAILWRADAATGRYTFVSRRVEPLLGYPAARWVDNPDFWLEIIHPEDRDFAASYRRKQVREGVGNESEYRVVAADGRFVWFREAIRILRHDPDGPAVLYGLMVNTSRRKKVERQLYTAKGELASQLRDMTYLHELTGRLAAARTLPETLDEVLSAAASLLGADRMMLWLSGADGEAPTLAASLGLTAEAALAVEGSGLAGLMDRAEPVSIEDIEAEPEGSTWQRAGRAGGFRAAAMIPMFARGGEPLGAIVITFHAPYRMGDRQAMLVEMYAGRAAQAIEAALELDRLERSDRDRAEALAEVLDTLGVVASQLEPGESGPAIDRQVRRLRQLVDGR